MCMRLISKTFAGGHKMSQITNITRTVKLIVGVVLCLLGLTTVDGSVSRTRRAIATADPDSRWTNGEIFYQLSPTLEGNLSALFQAMADWERHTCIRFLPATPNTRDKLLITAGGEHVCSFLGSLVGEQELVIGRRCREDKGLYLHQLGNAIGLLHEHQRPDRDQFVEIDFTNVFPARRGDFQKLNKSNIYGTLKIPYDYRSIMHLFEYAFTKGAARVIRTLDPTFQDVIGQRDSLSFRDIKTVNLVYSCAAKHCPQVRLDCTAYHAEAFIGSDCRCACPGEDMMSVKPCIPETQPMQKSSTTNHSGGEQVADSEQASLGVGAIVGIVAGVIIAFVIAVVIAVFVIKKRGKRYKLPLSRKHWEVTFYNAQTDGPQRNDSSLPNAERESENVYWEISESETEPPKDYVRPVGSPRELPAFPVRLHIGTNQSTDGLHSAASLNHYMHQSAATKQTGNRTTTDYLHPIASPSESTLKATKQPVCVEQWATSQSQDYLHPIASPSESTLKATKQLVRVELLATGQSQDYLHPIASPSESTLKATKQPERVEQWATSQSKDYLHPIASSSESTSEATKQPVCSQQGINSHSKDHLQPIASPSLLAHARTNQSTNEAEIGTCHSKLYLPHPPAESSNCHAPQPVRAQQGINSHSKDFLHPIASPSQSTPEATKQPVCAQQGINSHSKDYLHPIASPSQSTPEATKQPVCAQQGINSHSKDYLQPIASPGDLAHARTNQSTNEADIGTCHSKLYLPHPPAESSNCHTPQPSPVTHDLESDQSETSEYLAQPPCSGEMNQSDYLHPTASLQEEANPSEYMYR